MPSRTDLAAILATRRANPLTAMPVEPTQAELHADDIIRGAVHINAHIKKGTFTIIKPEPANVGRWEFLAEKQTQELAEAWCEGYCERRDAEKAEPNVTLEMLSVASNRAADEVQALEWDEDDELLNDAVNLTVNLTAQYAASPQLTLKEAIEASYGEESIVTSLLAAAEGIEQRLSS